MRKIRKLSFLGILVVVIAVLFLVGINFTQAEGKGKKVKPQPEPEATWAVELPGVGIGTMLYGDGTRYENTDGKVIIKVEKGKSMLHGVGKRQIVFYYYFCFKLVNPTNRYAGFQGVVLTTEGDPESPYCIFPGDTCMENFLNQDQPHSEYEYFYLKFQVDQFSFTESLGYTPEGIEDMTIGIPVKFTSHSDWIKIRVQNQEDFPDPYEYHNVECDERNYDDDDLTNMNIWIQRLELDKWRIYVGYNPNTGDSPGANLLFQEQYTQRVEGKGKKGAKTVTVVPLEATGNFSFYIDFIKNPTT